MSISAHMRKNKEKCYRGTFIGYKAVIRSFESLKDFFFKICNIQDSLHTSKPHMAEPLFQKEEGG